MTATDPRLADLLASARVEREARAARSWTSSAGEVLAFRVRVWATADALMTTANAPAVMDGLIATLSAAIAVDPGMTLDRVELAWGRRARATPGYRDTNANDEATDLPLHDPDALRDELARALRAQGREDLARALATARIDRDETSLRVTNVEPSSRAALRAKLAPLAPHVTVR